LLDINVLIALSDPEHCGHFAADQWRKRIGDAQFFLCAVTESGFVRLMASPTVGKETMKNALAMLRKVSLLPGAARLAIDQSWLELIAPFAGRLHGYRQVTDALLLGLAIKNNAVLVTLDRGIKALAGDQFATNVLTLS
jgi:toxin-antitoxin system PIN domain toxin